MPVSSARFSELRFGTTCESGINIKEAQYLHSLPKKPKLRSMLANQNVRRLLAEDALAKQYIEQKSFGDLITADHKVLDEESESRNNHRYAVVVQDFATQWIQSYPCKTTTSRETEKKSEKFLEPSKKPGVIYTDNSSQFGKSCAELSWNHKIFGRELLDMPFCIYHTHGSVEQLQRVFQICGHL